MLQQNPHALGADREIHRTAHAGREIRILRRPVGEVALLRHLERAHDRKIEVAATDHEERVGMMEECPALHQRGQALPGIDQVWIGFVRSGFRSHAENAVLAVEHDLAVLRDVIGDQRRQTDPQVDVPAVIDVLGGAPSHLRTGERGHGVLLTRLRCGR